MDDLTQSVTSAIQSSDHARLSSIFSSTQYQSLGQGEQRALSSHFVKMAISTSTFLPDGFREPRTMSVITSALNHLPPTVEGGADSVLRHMIFDYMVNEVGDYGTAARCLSGLRMEENDVDSVYYMSPVDRTDVFVKVAECYLEEDLNVEAEGAVTRAGTIIESAGIGIGGMSASSSSSNDDPEKGDDDGATSMEDRTVTLILRYKSTYARVLDNNRKFLQAALKYHDLSTAYLQTDAVDTDDLLIMLGRAVTCAILSPNSAQRQRVLGLVYKDERLPQLDAIPEFQSHSSVLTKMYLNRIVQKRELEQFESSLASHQKAVMADGLTIVERGVLEHNMVAVSQLYSSIYFNQLGELLGVVDAVKAERVAAKMISDGSLSGSIDEVEGILYFAPSSVKKGSALHWDETITSFCVQLSKVTDAVRSTG